MIQIDIDMPKNCMCCPFPSVGTDYYYCQCPGVEERAYDFKQAESIPDDCPLHEVIADPDTVSRKQAIDANCDDWCGCTNANCPHGSETEHYCDGCDTVCILKTLPPSPTPSRPQIHCNKCKHYQGVHDVQGHAPCDYWRSCWVLWNWYCSQAEPYKGVDA